MSASIARISGALRMGTGAAWLVTLVFVVGVAAVVGLATRRDVLPLAVGMVVLAVAVALSFRWPLLALAAFAALIPIEEVALIGGIGTVSRFAGLLFAATYGLPRIGRLAFGAMPTAGWAYLAWAIVSTGWAIKADVALGELATLLQLFIVAVLIADFVLTRPSIVRPILWVYSTSAAIIAIVGILSYGGTDARAAALQGQNPAQFAAVLVPALAFGLYEALSGSQRILGGAVAVVTTLGVLVSGTRGAWVAVAVVALLFILPQLTARWRLVAIAISAGFMALMVQLPGLNELVIGRLDTALSSGGAGRTDIWAVAAEIFQSAPVLGVGYANFPVAYTPEVVRAANVVDYTTSGHGPHNLVVGTVVELGPFGLALLAVFLLPLVLQRGWGPNAAAVQAAVASLLTFSLFLDIVGNRKQVWLFIGLAAGLAYLRRRNDGVSAGDARPDSTAGADPPPIAHPLARPPGRLGLLARHW